jgi:hypothetical protein
MRRLLTFFIFFATTQFAFANEVSKWDLSPDGAMVVTYRVITKDGVSEESFKHKILSQARKVSECNEVKIEGRYMYLITQEANPSVYMVDKVPYERLKEVFIVRKPYLDWVR